MPDHTDDAAAAGDRRAATPELPGDGGVLARVRRRTANVVVLPGGLAAVLVVGGWLWPRWFAGLGPSLLGGLAVALCLLAAALLAHRAHLWTLAGEAARDWPPVADRDPAPADERWVRGTCAEPRALHATGGPSLWRRARRHPRQVLPLRTDRGSLAAGEAVTLHGRRDAVLPRAGDALRVRAIAARGPFLIGRPSDGALFVADRWSFSSL